MESTAIYRFKFSQEVIDELNYFGTLHQYDDRIEFKESWNKWLLNPDVFCLLGKEVERLRLMGCRGNIMDKMFKSSRYYHRKRVLHKKTQENDTDKKRKHYVHLNKSMLRLMDDHILSCDSAIQPPSSYFIDFCTKNREDIIREIEYLVSLSPDKESKGEGEEEEIDATYCMNKIKKTYKTRLFKQNHDKQKV